MPQINRIPPYPTPNPAPPALDPALDPAPDPALNPAQDTQFYEGWHSCLLHLGIISPDQFNQVLSTDHFFAVDPPGALIATKSREELTRIVPQLAPVGGQ